MIYSGPNPPEEIYGKDRVNERVLLLGDDFSGCCLAYRRDMHCYGEVSDFGEWSALDKDTTVVEFLSQFKYI